GAVSRHAEGLAAQEADEVVDLPAAHNPRQRAAIAEPFTPFSERQLDDVVDLNVVRAVEVAKRAVEVEELRDGDARRRTADRVVAIADRGGRDGVGPGVVEVELVEALEAPAQARLHRVVVAVANRRHQLDLRRALERGGIELPPGLPAVDRRPVQLGETELSDL